LFLERSSPNVPHKKYRLLHFCHRQYQEHGPGGDYENPEKADPCFAKVVPGNEPVVQRLHRSHVEPGAYQRMSHYVAIRTVRLLSEEKAQEKIRAQQQHQNV